MNRFANWTRRAALALGAMALCAAAWAQDSTPGEVTKLDQAGARITLKHNGVKALDMPPMAMTFRLADPRLADGVAVGDQVRFVAERINGQYTVTSLSKAPK